MTHDTPPVLSAVLLHITGVASNSEDTDTDDTDGAFMQCNAMQHILLSTVQYSAVQCKVV